ncbi:MAG: glycosyltransferase family A protein [Chitinophagaceae bacterium]|nr:glycosyltransferase family A protein [Chitinophagaceae bacterium]
MAIRISVVIPCYNQGNFLSDALNSLSQCDASLFETIIVNDGSTDVATNHYLTELKEKGYNVISQENKGLSGARNTGIKHASAEYILLLDADNKIRPSFIVKGIEVFQSDDDVKVVYGDAEYFGDEKGLRKQGPFNLQRMMLVNWIDACTMVRKSVFDEVGYFDTNMKAGWEDWEMWLRIAFSGYKFHYLNEVVFDYRIRKNSMAKQVYNTREITNNIENYVFSKYPDKMGIHHVVDFMTDRFKKNPVSFLIKLFIRSYMPAYYKKLLRENKIRNGL